MAWARNIEQTCQRCCKRATREVLNFRNSSHGYFCAEHAKEEVSRLNREEAFDLQRQHGAQEDPC